MSWIGERPSTGTSAVSSALSRALPRLRLRLLRSECFSTRVLKRSFARLMISSITTEAFSMASGVPLNATDLSVSRSSFDTSILAPVSRDKDMIVSPPLPMSMPTNSCATCMTFREGSGFGNDGSFCLFFDWERERRDRRDLERDRDLDRDRERSRRSRERPSVSPISFLAFSMPSGEPQRCTARLSPFSAASPRAISIRTPLSFDIMLIVSPPLPISSLTNSCSTWIVICVGLVGFTSSTAFTPSDSMRSPVVVLFSARRPRPSLSSIAFRAYSMPSIGPVMCTRRSSVLSALTSLRMSMRAPLSFSKSLIISPPLPINLPMRSCETFNTCPLGAPPILITSRALVKVSSIICFALSMLA
mmetsp:Transcript_34694/g.95629  ORF Transcript_34694/g.95629 Transcript_34694/m.95629 type:complete len:361 (-) Transcript_34694:1621-2703(-)